MLQKIPIKKKLSAAGAAGAAALTRYRANCTEEQDKARLKKISIGRKKHHASMTQTEKNTIARKKKLTHKNHKKTLKGREILEYLQYVRKFYNDSLTPEEKELRNTNLRKKGKARWAAMTPEEKDACVKKMSKNRVKASSQIKRFIKFNVPREKNYCGVVRETAKV